MDLQAIEARLEAITETPWEERSEGIGEPWFVVHDSEYVAYVASLRSDQPADAEFIARAPEDMRALIAALERQSELIIGLEAEVHAQRQKLEDVKKLHRPISAECLDIEEIDSACAGCSGQLPNGRFVGKVVPYPCPTMRALGVTE